MSQFPKYDQYVAEVSEDLERLRGYPQYECGYVLAMLREVHREAVSSTVRQAVAAAGRHSSLMGIRDRIIRSIRALG